MGDKRARAIRDKTPQTSILLYELQQLLVQIKACSETTGVDNSKTVNQLSKYGLNLLHYALFAIENQQLAMPLTSISAGAALHDVVYELAPLAKAYGANIEFDASEELEPVHANKTLLKGSVYSLVAALITGVNSPKPVSITIAVQGTKPGEQRIGVYSNQLQIKSSLLNSKISKINSTARMKAPTASFRSGLGFAVSSELASRMNTKYSNFEHKNSGGVGFYLPQSTQLKLL